MTSEISGKLNSKRPSGMQSMAMSPLNIQSLESTKAPNNSIKRRVPLKTQSSQVTQRRFEKQSQIKKLQEVANQVKTFEKLVQSKDR